MKLGELIRKWRLMSEKSVREVAAEIGISAPTLNRIEHGESMSGEVLAAILAWLFLKPAEDGNAPAEQESAS